MSCGLFYVIIHIYVEPFNKILTTIFPNYLPLFIFYGNLLYQGSFFALSFFSYFKNAF